MFSSRITSITAQAAAQATGLPAYVPPRPPGAGASITSLRPTTPEIGGNDILRAGTGADLILGGTAADWINAGEGHNVVVGDHALLIQVAGVLTRVESVATADGYGGQAAPLLEAAEDTALQMGLSVLFAKVAMKNGGSGKRFAEMGYQVELNGFDPDKGYAVSYWRKALSAIAPLDVTVFNDDYVRTPSLSSEPLSPV